MANQPCPIYPERCHDPRYCVLGSPCVQADDRMLDVIGARQSLLPREGTGSVMDEQEQVKQILTAWKMALGDGEPTPSRQAAELAVRAMRRPREWVAGDTIPDDVTVLDGKDGLRWFKESDPNSDSFVWTTAVTTEIMLAISGQVREIPASEKNLMMEFALDRCLGGRKAEPEQEALASACDALARAVDVFMYISVKLGVNDAKKCRSAAAGCDRALTGLVKLTESET